MTGPVSVCTSIIDPTTFYKELRKKPEEALQVIDYVSDLLCGLARLMINAGASVIVIADPSASGEILGPSLFERFAVPALHKIVHAVHALNTPAIVHICGDMKSVKQFLPSVKADAISTDAMVNLRRLKAEFPLITTMGNMSTYLLEFGPEEKIVRTAENLIREGIDIIAPACGLSTSTPLSHIHAFTEKIKAYTP